ncbi:shikimate dehydrogenase [Shouchella miscanthi]|uniref:Shikimate dehydrogenase (NADP(+)) n=1 Tax=Shouchella miscanthi TaxID=2598861 RepID=A0ABU6NM61_9BACI|nr:shikimate dehydrogenase [Shouchella miscanthi]MED4127847.1 shikimate dehydrogenase [Shouchella miscanthi]
MKKFALIGQPLSHSLSPSIHRAAYHDMQLLGRYELLETAAEQVEGVIELVRTGEIDGLNVTIPHKVAVMPFLDAIDEDAIAIGAVNTIKKVGNQVIGYNTDAEGFKESLLERLHLNTVREQRVLVIGAGGAARAIVHTLGKDGAVLTIVNRTMSKAEDLAAMYPFDVTVLTIEAAEAMLNQFDIVINTTSVGMSSFTNASPIKLNQLASSTLVCDLIYNPLETTLLKEAKSRGNATLNGVGMLVNQAALAIEIWTGQKPNRKLMEVTLVSEVRK